MKRIFGVAAVALWAAGVARGQVAPAPTKVVDYSNYAERWVTEPKAVNPLLRHAAYRSEKMGVEVGYSVYLPPGYGEAANSAKRYPAIYWLHGLNQTENTDQFPPGIVDGAIKAGDVPPLIVVYVSAGGRTFYVDSPDGKLLGETTFVRELIPHIDATYRTVSGRGGRAIQGMSMGGWGAMRIGMTYPEVFSSVVSFAPSLRTPENLAATYPDVLERMFGGDARRFWAVHPLKLARERAERLKGLPIAFYCGNKDHLLPGSRDLHGVLTELGVRHLYEEVDGAAHDLTALVKQTGVGTLRFAVEGFGRE